MRVIIHHLVSLVLSYVITTIVKAGLYTYIIHTITYFDCTYLVVRHTESRFWYTLKFSAADIFNFKMHSSQTDLQ